MRKKRFVPCNNKFTIIELLIVVALIAILVTLLLPSLNSARRKAQTVLCIGQLKGIVQGVVSYTVDSDDWLPLVSEWSGQLVSKKYLPVPEAKYKMMGGAAAFKIRCAMICPSIPTPSTCSMWPAGIPENEWSPSNYVPSVSTMDWGEGHRTNGWGWRQQTEPLQKISRTRASSVMFGEFGYTGQNGSVQNNIGIFYYYQKVSSNPSSSLFFQHSPFTINLAFFGGSIGSFRFPADVEIFNQDFSRKR